MQQQEADFFQKLANQQSPEYLWIGCSDSRVPANQIIGLLPGEVFVHRNVANLIVHTDFNCLSVVQYAVEVLKVKHIIVCGHYGCGGVNAAMGLNECDLGLIHNWLRHIRDVQYKHEALLADLPSDRHRAARLCELNVIEQANNLCHTTIVRKAWAQGRDLTIHAWVYSLHDGLLRDLGLCTTHRDEVAERYRYAIAAVADRDELA